MQTIVKNKIAAVIQHRKIENPIILSFNKKDTREINWIDTNEEFTYNGKRYDVIKITDQGDSLSIYCIHDSEEDKLFQLLEANVDNQIIGSNNLVTKNSFHTATKLYFLSDMTCSVILYESLIHPSSLTRSFYASVHFETSSPPPRLT